MNVLYLSNEIKYTCGVSNHIYHLLNSVSENQDLKIFLITGRAEAREKFEEFDITVLENSLFLHENRTVLNYLRAIRYLIKFVKKNSIHIIHSHSHYCANIAKMVSKFTKVKTIQTNHGIWKHQGRLKQFNADRYIAINEHIRNYLVASGTAKENEISFIRCGIPIPEKFIEKNFEKMKILCASRLISSKGIHIYISAVSKLLNKHSSTEFLIAGEGAETQKFTELCTELKTGIKFLGRVTDIYSLLKQIHVFVFCGLTDEEGFPAVLTEAAATSNIIITSDFLGVRNVFDENDVLFYKPGDADELSRILERVIDNPKSFIKHSENAYKKIKKEFQLKDMSEKHLKLYTECLKELNM